LAFGIKMSQKSKPTSPSAMKVKNWWKTTNITEKLGIISKLAEGEQIFYICCNVSCVHISICTICENADGITDSAKSGTEVYV
jgi:hypothetical protein